MVGLLGGLALSWLGAVAHADCGSDRTKCQLQCVASNGGDGCRSECHAKFRSCTRDKARAAKAGCIAGQYVAPLHTLTFRMADGRTVVADIGDPLEVDGAAPVIGDRCDVVGQFGRGDKFKAAVALNDIGPFAAVRAALAAQAYNQIEEISLAAFPEKLRTALVRRAKTLTLNPSDYSTDIALVTDLVALCSEVTEEQLLEANLRRAPDGKNNETYTKFYHCQAATTGLQFGTTPRGIVVTLGLRSETKGSKYHVLIEFEHKPDDANRILAPKPVSEAMLNFYDAYGIGNFYVIR